MTIAIIISVITVVLSILVHYEFLNYATKIRVRHRRSLISIILVILVAHIVECFIFTISFYILHHLGLGSLIAMVGEVHNSFIDFLYFSLTTFSTLGYGDSNPLEYFKLLASIESLLGFVLITWSASFLFFEMQKGFK
jgi:hypothetical protein